MKRLYGLLTNEKFEVCGAREKYQKLLFALSFFNAILIERRKFGQLGWNSTYFFNDGDFEVTFRVYFGNFINGVYLIFLWNRLRNQFYPTIWMNMRRRHGSL